jgi:hypothetical protein
MDLHWVDVDLDPTTAIGILLAMVLVVLFEWYRRRSKPHDPK